MQSPCRRSVGQALLLTGLISSVFVWLLPASAAAFWPFSSSRTATPPVEASSTARQKPAVAPRAEESAAAGEQPAAAQAARLQEQVQDLASELLASLEDPDPENGELADGLIVTTFVELKKLTRTSSFGRYLAEQLMGEMQQQRYQVVELRKSRSVMVQARRGEYGLSRDPARLREEVAAGAMLSGTYTLLANAVAVNARIIDNRSGRLLASAAALFPRDRETELLLADSASASSRQPEPMYLKRLDP